jgi:hypothetical protein
MSEQESTRRKFLKLLGLTAGAGLIENSVLAGSLNREEILKLNKEQQEFMLLYEKWMDEFIGVIRIQKTEPHNVENQKRMMALTEIASEWKPQLTEYMKEKNFALIYNASIERMKTEI